MLWESNMALKPAICTQCGGQIEVDDSKEAGICQFCGTAFITEKVIHQFVTQNNFAGATFNIQGGVDIENLYTLARRAVEANNKDDVLKYYGQIRERDPNDWESTFFYAWFENGENFEKYFQTTEDLILKLDSGKKFEALNRLYTFFKNIKFTFEVAYGETSPFPLKNQDLYYDFVKKLFEEKNTEIINIAGNLTYFMEFWKGQKKFYLDILSTQDKTYLPYLKEFHWVLHVAPSLYADEQGCADIIKEVETNIERLNALLDSEDDKKNNYLAYYKWLIEKKPERFLPANIKYLENRIKELDSTYSVSSEAMRAAKQNLSEKQGESSSNASAIILIILSIIAEVALFYTSHTGWGALLLIPLLILNFMSKLCSGDRFASGGKKFGCFIIKTLILAILFLSFKIISD